MCAWHASYTVVDTKISHTAGHITISQMELMEDVRSVEVLDKSGRNLDIMYFRMSAAAKKVRGQYLALLFQLIFWGFKLNFFCHRFSHDKS